MSYHIERLPTTPYFDQKPGTSGLRKKVKVFLQQNYTINFVQSILNALGNRVDGCTLIIGGDGRYYMKEAIQIIIQICAANKVSKLIVGQNGILSTPAASNLIRLHKTLGGIILTASHNPGGVENDFGIKFNCENGGPAPDNLTADIFELSKILSDYKICNNLQCNIDIIGNYSYNIEGQEFSISVIDPLEDYINLMKTIFDFHGIQSFIANGFDGSPLKLLIDSMNGVTGPYVERIFVQELKCDKSSITRMKPLPDFGNIHPDPNLTYAKTLVDRVGNENCHIGAAFDGDGDRNMIIGRGPVFVTPSDSLAVLAHHLKCIPYFSQNGVKGFARSMPTSTAIDNVASQLGIDIYEVPTGWKYFGNLMDAGKLSLCGEESFGTGSDHIREKDGVWALLAWLSIMKHTNKEIKDILSDHWKLYGRNYFLRYDYEECSTESCDEMMKYLFDVISDPSIIGKKFDSLQKQYQVKTADEYSYRDPIDDSFVSKQGLRFIFDDGSRFIIRLSGTGSSGTTVRLYLDSYEKTDIDKDVQSTLQPLLELALNISRLREYTGRCSPTVIT
ncbi:phosphoglucomutase [Ctenocephalides felis]|uniref:phosphoglucomutase n=1 Tax=Ctenocephalides felis TaxID=7515 RepID=UPI000E6E3DA7|nr:phosphoglucomutase [Ctenocephalides felis]